MECEVRPPSSSPKFPHTRTHTHNLTLTPESVCTPQLFLTVDIVHPETGKQTATLVLGRVRCFHIRNDVLNERGLVDFTKLQPIGRVGDISYTRVGDGFRLARPSWAAEGAKIQEQVKSTL